MSKLQYCLQARKGLLQSHHLLLLPSLHPCLNPEHASAPRTPGRNTIWSQVCQVPFLYPAWFCGWWSWSCWITYLFWKPPLCSHPSIWFVHSRDRLNSWRIGPSAPGLSLACGGSLRGRGWMLRSVRGRQVPGFQRGRHASGLALAALYDRQIYVQADAGQHFWSSGWNGIERREALAWAILVLKVLEQTIVLVDPRAPFQLFIELRKELRIARQLALGLLRHSLLHLQHRQAR